MVLLGWRSITRLHEITHHQLQLHLWCRYFSSNVSSDFYTLNKKITHFIQINKLDEARSLFDQTGHKNIVTWNSMISGYIKRREMATARQLFNQMPHRDVVSWNLIISGYISCRGGKFVDYARTLFDEMPQRDHISWNTMISGYAKNGRMDEALLIFNTMPQKNVVSWNAIVTGYLQNAQVSRAIEFFQRMPQRDSASLSALVSGLVQNGDLDEASRMLFKCASTGNGNGEHFVQAYNTLIAGYGQKGKVEEARQLFDQIPFKRNAVSWNSMIMCYVKAEDIFSARDLFNQMVHRDDISWNTIISGYVNMSDMEEALNLFRKMPNPDAVTWNLMVSGYAQMRNLDHALTFFERMPKKNLVSWNTMIAGYEKNKDYKAAVKLFFTLLHSQIAKPDRHTLSSILSASAGLVDLHLGMQIHQMVIKTVIPDLPIYNSLITMYSRCGEITMARTVFDDMELRKDVITWNAMIGGYGSHGLASEALELFNIMKKTNVKPSYITFISVLSACAHAGLIDEGQQNFRSMVNEYGIEPRLEHFSSVVDILCRHGQIDEAMDIINSMPCVPDKAVWGALLSACRVHNNVKLARVAAEELMRLEPESSSPFVLLSNTYADGGRWDEATQALSPK
ncbi:hypothetical protein ACFE04_020558 [Oxalis oulophora]